jgi:hypothetical protein
MEYKNKYNPLDAELKNEVHHHLGELNKIESNIIIL